MLITLIIIDGQSVEFGKCFSVH